jgi:hypothetical protein
MMGDVGADGASHRAGPEVAWGAPNLTRTPAPRYRFHRSWRPAPLTRTGAIFDPDRRDDGQLDAHPPLTPEAIQAAVALAAQALRADVQ